MLDFDLAHLYQVENRTLKQAVRRNLDRFPEDFMFELSPKEYNSLKISLRSQIVTLDTDGRGKYPKYPPFAFTEMGVAMLSSVLRSETAIMANIAIMRAFVTMRNYIMTTQQVTQVTAIKPLDESQKRFVCGRNYCQAILLYGPFPGSRKHIANNMATARA